MNTSQLSTRRAELQVQATNEKIDWSSRIAGLTSDPLVVLALATLLKFNLQAAMDPFISVPDLIKQREEHQQQSALIKAQGSQPAQ